MSRTIELDDDGMWTVWENAGIEGDYHMFTTEADARQYVADMAFVEAAETEPLS